MQVMNLVTEIFSDTYAILAARFNRSKVHGSLTISLRFGRSITLFSTRKSKTEQNEQKKLEFKGVTINENVRFRF